ncbi:MAG: isoprenylcysteine carboxylmethyltransferase family protein [Burkholderiales bacterium]|nr:isoprenylcysteine carboxylmethyltransferase family protein [Anaerolineae bacterium]
MFRQLRAIAMPFIIIVVIPALLASTGSVNIGWGLPMPLALLPIIVGAALIAVGLALMLMTIRLLITVGEGTLSPWDATRRLVVVGIYRYVRNPMISGGTCILLGESVLLGSWVLLVVTLFFAGLNVVYIPLSEERGLRERFGADYDTYARNVPRWLPRRTAWEQ